MTCFQLIRSNGKPVWCLHTEKHGLRGLIQQSLEALLFISLVFKPTVFGTRAELYSLPSSFLHTINNCRISLR